VCGGHSTGGKVSLMIGALHDTYQGQNVAPLYMKGTEAGKHLNNDMINILPKIKAIVADHPDLMSLTFKNPDIPNYIIDKIPVFINTGNRDTWIVRPNSSWNDWRHVTSPIRFFMDVDKRGHLEPLLSCDEAPAIVHFYKTFVYKTEDTSFFFGPHAMHGLNFAENGSANTGDGKVSYIGCSPTETISYPYGYTD